MRALPHLRQLQHLVALADHLNFGRAADACGVTQSTMSASIQEFERLIGAPVAERTKRSVRLTPLGRRLVERSRSILREAEGLMDEAAAARDPMAGVIELGVIPTIGPFLLPRLVPHLMRTYPNLRLTLREDKTTALLERLADGRLDLALMAFPYATPGCDTMMLFSDAYRFACSAKHPLARAASVDAGAADPEALMLLERDHCLHSHALPLLEDLQDKAPGRFSATSLYTLVAMVGEGMGVTLLPDLAIGAGILQGGGVVVRPLSGPVEERQVGLCWRRQSARAGAFKSLGGTIAEWAQANLRPWRNPEPAAKKAARRRPARPAVREA